MIPDPVAVRNVTWYNVTTLKEELVLSGIRPWSFNFPGYVRVGPVKVFPGPQFISSPIVLALILGLFLLFALYIGIGCLMAIQRPVRISAQPLILSKEY